MLPLANSSLADGYNYIPLESEDGESSGSGSELQISEARISDVTGPSNHDRNERSGKPREIVS